MSLTFKGSTKATPIAKTTEGRILYLLKESKMYPDIPKRHIYEQKYMCPFCKKELSTKQKMMYHVHNICTKRNVANMNPKPVIDLPEGEQLFKLPDQYECIFLTGPPGCGKSFWVNEYVKRFKELYDNKVFLISRLEHDSTLDNDIDNYIRIAVNNDFDYKLEDFTNSVVIFDDIESAEHKKGTDKAYFLLDDICKNGRHHNISVIFCNQEIRMGRRTKCILTVITALVLFPSVGNKYQMSYALRDHIGMDKSQINKVMELQSRWAYVSRTCPQYILHQNGAYLLNKQY
jgi:hypothetical protein